MRRLWSRWPEIGALIARQSKVLLLVDFDGTLAPIARAPEEARLPAEIRALLAGFRYRRRVSVAILSGRSLADLRSVVGLPSLYYGGNHGLEIRGPGVSFRSRQAVSTRPVMRSLVKLLRVDLRGFRGVAVEDKGLTLSVHYRRVRRAALPRLQRALGRLRARTSSLPVRWRTGHRVWEVLPEGPWDKGAATRYLMRRLGRPFPVALGDDRTDEDIFAALRGQGISIRVGRKRSSCADFYLDGQGQVVKFLKLVSKALDVTT